MVPGNILPEETLHEKERAHERLVKQWQLPVNKANAVPGPVLGTPASSKHPAGQDSYPCPSCCPLWGFKLCPHLYLLPAKDYL